MFNLIAATRRRSIACRFQSSEASKVQHNSKLTGLFGSLELPTANRRVSSDRRVLSTFLFWLAERGASFPDVDILPLDPTEPDCHWGIFAARDIPAGQIVASVPGGSTFSANDSFGNEEYENSFAALLELIPTELQDLKLGLRLLAERCRPYEKHSSWWPYIGALPLHVSGVPLFYSQHQLQELQYAPLQVQVRRRALIILRLAPIINQHFSHLFFGHQVDAHALGWAMTVTSSRAFGFGPLDKRMLPLIDVMNHSHAPSAKVVLRSHPETLVVRSTRDLLRGQELTIDYGAHTNDDFLLHYGFLPTKPTKPAALIQHPQPTAAAARQASTESSEVVAAFTSSSPPPLTPTSPAHADSAPITVSGDWFDANADVDFVQPHDSVSLAFDPNMLEIAAEIAGAPFAHPLDAAPAWKQRALLRHAHGGLLRVPPDVDDADCDDTRTAKQRALAAFTAHNRHVRYLITPPPPSPASSSPASSSDTVDACRLGVDRHLLACLRILYADADANANVERSPPAGEMEAAAAIAAMRPTASSASAIGIDTEADATAATLTATLPASPWEATVEAAVERRVLQTAQAVVLLALQSFASSATDDAAALRLLRAGDADGRRILHFRLAKKRILEQSARALQQRVL